MAFLRQDETLSRGNDLIRAELNQARDNLKARQGDLTKARAHVAELEDTIARLTKKVADLEHDQRALDRGYIALMCDRNVPDETLSK